MPFAQYYPRLLKNLNIFTIYHPLVNDCLKKQTNGNKPKKKKQLLCHLIVSMCHHKNVQ